MTDALAQHIDLEPDQAETMKLAVGLAGTVLGDEFDPDQIGRVREALNQSVEAFARELVASLQFYQSQTNSLGIGEILIAGGTARLVGFADALEQMVGVVVRVGDPFANLGSSKSHQSIEPDPALAVAIGLGLGR
jgi:type IV pilus assembly protein PilM